MEFYLLSSLVPQSFFHNLCPSFIMPFPPDSVAKTLCFQAVSLLRSSICLSREILLLRYLINSLSNVDETYRVYSLAPTDNLVRFWKSEVKITAGRPGGEVHLLVWPTSRSFVLHCVIYAFSSYL